jgi:hypothetical protein
MCAQLGDGRVTAIDRSATAIRRAAAPSTDHVAAGRALLRQLDLAPLDLAGQRFDKIVAVNVSALWIGPADTEWDRVLRHLRPAGTVHLFHRSASPTRTLRVAELMAQAMAAHGLAALRRSAVACGVRRRRQATRACDPHRGDPVTLISR